MDYGYEYEWFGKVHQRVLQRRSKAMVESGVKPKLNKIPLLKMMKAMLWRPDGKKKPVAQPPETRGHVFQNLEPAEIREKGRKEAQGQVRRQMCRKLISLKLQNCQNFRQDLQSHRRKCLEIFGEPLVKVKVSPYRQGRAPLDTARGHLSFETQTL